MGRTHVPCMTYHLLTCMVYISRKLELEVNLVLKPKHRAMGCKQKLNQCTKCFPHKSSFLAYDIFPFFKVTFFSVRFMCFLLDDFSELSGGSLLLIPKIDVLVQDSHWTMTAAKMEISKCKHFSPSTHPNAQRSKQRADKSTQNHIHSITRKKDMSKFKLG